MKLRLRPLTVTDYHLLLEWLQRPHVKTWWNDGDDTLEKVAQHYGRTSARKERFILLAEIGDDSAATLPIGYMQYEVDDHGIASVDQFIGEQEMLSQGIGTRAIIILLDYITTRHKLRMATVDPHPANSRAIRCYEKVGFTHDPALTAPDGTAAYMMKIAYSTK